MPLLRRRSSHGLPAVLGVGDLFSTAYGNVGSSIYYALGVTALYAGGMTPVTFAISGVIFAFTAATYAEATARFPEAGGSASFSRRAFNEAVSFFAAWAQMLNYTVTIAISAYTVPPYLSVFPGCGFMRNGLTGQVVVAAGLCVVLALLNIRGIQESARLNIFLAIADLATQALLVVVGVALILDPQVLVGNVHFGTTPTVSAFLISIPIGMVAYTGIETISNMAEEARDPARDVPRSIGLVAAAVFAIYAFLPAVALSAMPMHQTPALSHPPGTGGTHYWTALGAKYAGDPVQGIVQNLGLGPLTTPVSYYVGLLAGTILIIATNAGLIGVSRLTYSMGVHRQFPDFLRTVHPTWRTPWVAIVVYTVAAIGMIGAAKVAGGQGVAFLGNLYAFGAMLSFTIAHASVIALRVRKSKRDPEQPFRAPLNIRVGQLDIPLFAVLGGLGTFAAFIVVAALFPAVRWAGLGWLVLGMLVYVAYRKKQGLPLTKTVFADTRLRGPAIEIEYRTIVLHITDARVADEMTATALRLASERRARIVAVYTLEVPAARPLTQISPEDEARANGQLAEAEALGQVYGVQVISRLVRTRNAGRALVEEANRRGSEIIVLGSPGRSVRSARLFGSTVDYVLRHARCRVMVGATPEWRGAAHAVAPSDGGSA
ncbi:MAG TPA: universal stress protein [Gaiellales bacterium]|nr:universal stress protein [Gaiellales bacterium]